MCEKYGQIAGQRDKAVRLPVRRLVSQAKSRQIFFGEFVFSEEGIFLSKAEKMPDFKRFISECRCAEIPRTGICNSVSKAEQEISIPFFLAWSIRLTQSKTFWVIERS